MIIIKAKEPPVNNLSATDKSTPEHRYAPAKKYDSVNQYVALLRLAYLHTEMRDR